MKRSWKGGGVRYPDHSKVWCLRRVLDGILWVISLNSSMTQVIFDFFNFHYKKLGMYRNEITQHMGMLESNRFSILQILKIHLFNWDSLSPSYSVGQCSKAWVKCKHKKYTVAWEDWVIQVEGEGIEPCREPGSLPRDPGGGGGQGIQENGLGCVGLQRSL